MFKKRHCSFVLHFTLMFQILQNCFPFCNRERKKITTLFYEVETTYCNEKSCEKIGTRNFEIWINCVLQGKLLLIWYETHEKSWTKYIHLSFFHDDTSISFFLVYCSGNIKSSHFSTCFSNIAPLFQILH